MIPKMDNVQDRQVAKLKKNGRPCMDEYYFSRPINIGQMWQSTFMGGPSSQISLLVLMLCQDSALQFDDFCWI
jgi:hypothetical protein